MTTLAIHLPRPWPPLWAVLLPLVVGVIILPWAVGLLARAGMGQKIREEGPRSHMAKGGTPTSGGLVVIALVLLGVLLLDPVRGNLFHRLLPGWEEVAGPDDAELLS
ncbi:MAG: hypothetical protein ABR573_06980, partial [Candidatus Dormibacteria bacterium]